MKAQAHLPVSRPGARAIGRLARHIVGAVQGFTMAIVRRATFQRFAGDATGGRYQLRGRLAGGSEGENGKDEQRQQRGNSPRAPRYHASPSVAGGVRGAAGVSHTGLRADHSECADARARGRGYTAFVAEHQLVTAVSDPAGSQRDVGVEAEFATVADEGLDEVPDEDLLGAEPSVAVVEAEPEGAPAGGTAVDGRKSLTARLVLAAPSLRTRRQRPHRVRRGKARRLHKAGMNVVQA
ncbi:MAG: hypothetical protein JWQ60_4632 [Pseudonocardia sp.]|nr:hypothetical protein [Pseudonocardia sp.]